MKKILFAFAFILSVTLLNAQSLTPREGNTTGTAKSYVPKILTQYLTDATLTTDTVMISPNGHLNQYFINWTSGDTLKGTFCIGVKDSTINGRAKYATDDNCKAGDRMEIYYKTTGLKTDTINFYGNIICDTLGTANNKRIVIRKDTNKSTYMVPFWFDGNTWVQATYGTAGNFIGRP